MGSKKHRIHNTDIDNLISNLRGEVGEIIFTWILMRSFIAEANTLTTSDIEKDMANPRLSVINALIDKLSDEIVARLSELAELKIGRLTFYFAHVKLNQLQNEVSDYSRFIKRQGFHQKRNYDISHKELPEKWSDHKSIHIPYETILKGIAIALKLMKAIDSAHLGPRAKYLWREMRRRRYSSPYLYPAKVGYMLMPYLWLSQSDRAKIIKEETQDGRDIWVDMQITVNGKETTIKAYGELGAIILGGRLILFDESFVELTSINFGVREGDNTGEQDSSK
jgi:hypothetical protein